MASLRGHLLPLLQQLPSQPAPSDCNQIVELIVEACRTRTQPKKALAVTLRHIKAHMTAEVHRLVSNLVSERLDVPRLPTPAPVAIPTGRWLSLRAAAAVLELHPNSLAERLRTVRYRRLYGWPIWDGHQWRLAAAAIDPATAAACLATLPADEPLAIGLMLPDWCERTPRTAADPACGTPPTGVSKVG